MASATLLKLSVAMLEFHMASAPSRSELDIVMSMSIPCKKI